MKINILIPCYNEEESIKQLYKNLVNFDSEFNINFYILNNGSTDNTSSIIEQLEETEKVKFLSIGRNEGYGFGVNFGLNEIPKTNFIGWFHGDLQFEIENLKTIYKKISEEYSKNKSLIFFKGVRRGRSFVSNIFSFFMGVIASFLLREKLYEINAQPTIFSSELIYKISNPPNDFSYDTYVYWLARKNKYKFIREKVNFPNRQFGASKWDFGIWSKLQFSYKNLKYILDLRKQ